MKKTGLIIMGLAAVMGIGSAAGVCAGTKKIIRFDEGKRVEIDVEMVWQAQRMQQVQREQIIPKSLWKMELRILHRRIPQTAWNLENSGVR